MSSDVDTSEDGVYSVVSPASYHADKTTLSASGAKLLLPPSTPAHFRYRQDNPPPPKPHFDFGAAAHKFVLGEGDEIAPVYADDWRTKDARAQRDSAHAEGKIPLLITDVEKAMAMANAVHAHPEAARLLKQGDAEVSLFATDPATGVRLRGRPDWMTHRDGRLWIVDYKSAISANPDVFARKAVDYFYHLQKAWYIALTRLLGLDESPAFVFICQEKEPPYLTSVIELDADAFALGCRQMAQAIHTFADCAERGEWPGYGAGIASVSLPRWAFSEPTLADLIEID